MFVKDFKIVKHTMGVKSHMYTKKKIKIIFTEVFLIRKKNYFCTAIENQTVP